MARAALILGRRATQAGQELDRSLRQSQAGGGGPVQSATRRQLAWGDLRAVWQ